MIPYIHHNISLQSYNTFGLPCIARDFVDITSIEQAQTFFASHDIHDHQTLFLGGGSNILLTRDVFDGLVIKNSIMGIETTIQGDKVTLQIGGGENWHDLVMMTVQQGRSGIENLALIPGTVGAAPIQNIGAYGVEAKDVITHVTYIDTSTGESITLTAEACRFGYRDSIFKQELLGCAFVVGVTMELSVSDENYTPLATYAGLRDSEIPLTRPLAVAQRVIAIRQSKLPDWHTLGTAGSFFKNPVITKKDADPIVRQHPQLRYFVLDDGSYKFNAGQLLDLAGYKGYTDGHVGTYEKHALVLVHHGGGSGQDIVALSQQLQQGVYEKFGIMLEPEVRFV